MKMSDTGWVGFYAHPLFLFTISFRRLVSIPQFLCFVALANFTVGQPGGGIIEHRIPSPHQAGDTTVRILLPDMMVEGKRYPTLYVLPVRAESDGRHGQGLTEIRRLNIQNRYDVICIAPGFSEMPWYNDHALDPLRWDESHFLKTVLPFVEANYPVRSDGESRFLLGFSKSGWGAISLLLRYPEFFAKAAAWDTGIRVDLGPMEPTDRVERMIGFWGSAENFERYRLSNLIKTHGADLGAEARLLYYSPAGVRAMGGARFHQLMVEAEIPHRYVFEPARRHSWESGWIPEAVAFLLNQE